MGEAEVPWNLPSSWNNFLVPRSGQLRVDQWLQGFLVELTQIYLLYDFCWYYDFWSSSSLSDLSPPFQVFLQEYSLINHSIWTRFNSLPTVVILPPAQGLEHRKCSLDIYWWTNGHLELAPVLDRTVHLTCSEWLQKKKKSVICGHLAGIPAPPHKKITVSPSITKLHFWNFSAGQIRFGCLRYSIK